MKFILKLLPLVFFGVIIYSCCKDDEELAQRIPTDRGEQYIVDKAKIENYLKSHRMEIDPVTLEVTLIKLTQEQIDNPLLYEEEGIISLWGQDGTQANLPARQELIRKHDARDYRTTALTRIDDNVDYTLHYFVINEGGVSGGSQLDYKPHVYDSLLCGYKNWNLEKDVMMEREFAPRWFDLQNQIAVSAFRQIIPTINIASGFTENNGQVTFQNFGSVLVFVPSGLAYFSSGAGSNVQPFDCLGFQINAYNMKRKDSDFIVGNGTNLGARNDFIPNIFEFNHLDFNNIMIFDPVTKQTLDLWSFDSDGDGVPNFLDADDDGDSVLTRREIRKKYDGLTCSLPKWYDTNGIFQNVYNAIPYNEVVDDDGNPIRVHLNSGLKYNSFNMVGGVNTAIPPNDSNNCWPSN
jgi:hypothetical protein